MALAACVGDTEFGDAVQIYMKYMSAGGFEEVNLSARLRKQPFTETDHVKILDEAQTEVVRMMALDAFPRFLRSAFCDALLADIVNAGRSGAADLLPATLAKSLKSARQGMLHARGRWLDLFKAVAEMVPECIVISDMSRPGVPIVHANQAFYQLTGYAQNDIIGRNCRLLQGPGTSMETVERIRHAIRNGGMCQCEILNYKKDGTPFRNLLTLSPVWEKPFEAGATTPPSADTGSTLDITERTSTDAALPLATSETPRRRLAYYIGLQFEVTDASLVATRMLKHAALLRILPKYTTL